MSAAGSRYMAKVAATGCVVCRRMGFDSPAQVHHVAEGSSQRSDFATVALCHEHHLGTTGFHTLKEERFCKLFRVPWFKEVGLLIWQNEDMHR